MTSEGDKIPNLTKGRVREQLTDETDPKAIKRLTVAREYLEGLFPADIEEKYEWNRQTIYNWLNRFEDARGVEVRRGSAGDRREGDGRRGGEPGQVPCDKQDRRAFSPYHSELFVQMASRDVLRGLEAGFGPGRLRGA